MAKEWSLIFSILYSVSTQCDSKNSCKCEFPHGRVSLCSESLSSVNCADGYEATVSWVICSTSGEWVPAFGSFSVIGDISEGLCIPKSCPSVIPNGVLSPFCSPKVGLTCEYSCDVGFTKTRTSIVCDKSTNWSTNPHALCTNSRQCPYEVHGGNLNLSCERHPGHTCSYTCREGFLPLGQRLIYCDVSLAWNRSLQSLCKEIQCPRTIENGFISESCSRSYKDYCDSDSYVCNPGYMKSPASPGLRCNGSGQWEWSDGVGKPCYYEADMCPSRISNGELTWPCSRQPGAVCAYSCDLGCIQNIYVSRLHCGLTGHWIQNTEKLCTNCMSPPTTRTTTTSLCPATIPGGRMDSSCSRGHFTSCHFTCDFGCTSGTIGTRLFCVAGLWHDASTACYCSDAHESSTSHFYTPPYSRSTSSTAVIGGVTGAVAFVIILGAVCTFAAIKRKTQSQHDVTGSTVYRRNMTVGRQTSSSISQGVTSPTYGVVSINFENPSQQINYTSQQSPYNHRRNESSQQHVNFVQEPPAYSSLSPKPTDAPPSYEQVTDNPTEFTV